MTKTLILTGGSQGIGKKTLERFTKENWNAINLSRHPSHCFNTTDIAVDFLNPQWETILQKELFPRLKKPSSLCVIHNAAMLSRDRVGNIPEKELKNTLTLNVMIPALLNNLLVPWMAPSSSILYVGSTLSEMAVPGCASYVISKHAIVGLMRATCQDLTSQGIHTACICPGITHTSMLETRCDEDPKQLEALKKVSLPERFVEPEEIADVLWFAAQHPVINGSVIHGNLGQKTT